MVLTMVLSKAAMVEQTTVLQCVLVGRATLDMEAAEHCVSLLDKSFKKCPGTAMAQQRR